MEYKKLYISAHKQYPIEPEILARLHCVSCDKVENWLDQQCEDSPDFSAIYELHMLISRLELAMPHDLLKCVLRSQNRVVELIESLDKNPITKEKISKQKRTRTRRAVYYYNKKPLYSREIAKKLGLDISHSTIIAKIRAAGLKVGDAIDDVDFSRKRAENKSKAAS
ncbi:hypothetical protein [Shewanella decolorationis]|uniref:hypothetical protein n=1 Tax=Shewanella decolorationis TaxID=256839 RepID=UPI001056E63C|nr:hypothetical protein [Shewanella decolorationis]